VTPRCPPPAAAIPSPQPKGASVEAPATAKVGHLPRYGLDSDRPRWRIIADYAARHNLTVAEIDTLVRELPDYGVKSMLAGSLATLVTDNVVELAEVRARRARGRRNTCASA
jgi:hypothetical protein